MADFIAAGNNIGNVNKGRRWAIIILLVVCVVLFINRQEITPAINELKSMLFPTDSESAVEEVVVQATTETDEKIFEAILLSNNIPKDAIKVPIAGIAAESTLVNADGNEYSADNMIDGNNKTSWQEGDDGFGEGNTISLVLSEKANIRYLVIYNGNQSKDGSYKRNNRLKKIKIVANNQSCDVELQDTKLPQVIQLSGLDSIKSLAIDICSVYEGSEFDDTCVSEIQCYK